MTGLLTVLSEMSSAASLTMFLTLLPMLFSTVFLLSSLQLSLGLLLDETYIVRMTVYVYSALWHVQRCMSASMSGVRIIVQVVSRHRK